MRIFVVGNHYPGITENQDNLAPPLNSAPLPLPFHPALMQPPTFNIVQYPHPSPIYH